MIYACDDCAEAFELTMRCDLGDWPRQCEYCGRRRALFSRRCDQRLDTPFLTVGLILFGALLSVAALIRGNL